MKYLYFHLREYLFPSGCGVCKNILFDKEDAYYGLCVECRSFLSSALAEGERCDLCGKLLISEKERCLSCRKIEGSISYSEQIVKLKALFPYTGKFKTVLGAFKFGKSLGVGNFLADSLCKSLEDFVKERDMVLVPVPPRPGKIKKQGWDQNEYLAKRLGSIGAYPLKRCLKRLRSRSQKELNRKEREENLKGRIICTKKPPKDVILFDDVVTTGATLNACATALLEGGTKTVYAICLFYD